MRRPSEGITFCCWVMAMSNVLQALVAIQSELKAPKDQNAGRYRYRNIEDINEAVKPLAANHGCAVVYTDDFTDDERCVSTCKLIADDGEITATGVSYINRQPKNMSIEQASGAASSYARKYAACGLFAIDSSENDPDRVNAKPKMEDAGVKAAKKRLWDAMSRWGDMCGKTPEEVLAGVKKRPDWAETADFFNSVADEFLGDMEG